MADDATSLCGECGASVYRELIDSGIAKEVDGKLLGKHCLEDHERSSDSSATGDVVEFEPIQMEEDDEYKRPLDMSGHKFPAPKSPSGSPTSLGHSISGASTARGDGDGKSSSVGY